MVRAVIGRSSGWAPSIPSETFASGLLKRAFTVHTQALTCGIWCHVATNSLSTPMSWAPRWRHHEVLIALAGCVTHFESELWEYLERDFLNLALGNRDNHGRNMAVLKSVDGSLELAPIYDFGPSFLDARAIARVVRWDGEEAGRRDWNHIVRNLQTRLEEAGVVFPNWPKLLKSIRSFADKLSVLPDMMRKCGVAAHIIEQRHPEIQRLVQDLRALKDS